MAKSIKQQFIDLREGRMTQQNFMRSLRQNLPQYITNVTSYKDSIKILKNKGILNETDIKEGIGMFHDPVGYKKPELSDLDKMFTKEYKGNGIYVIYKNGKEVKTIEGEGNANAWINNETRKIKSSPNKLREKNLDVDQEELKKGIEVEKEHTDDPVKAEEIALDHLAEDPQYYTKLDKAGLEENEEELSPRMKQIQKSMGDMNRPPITPERAKELKAKINAEREKNKKTSLKEAKDEKGKWTNTSGKSMYEQFKEIDNLNSQEVLIGIDYEMQKNHELSKKDAAKIVLKNLKKNPIYYTSTIMSGIEGYEPEYIGGKSAQPEAWQMQPVKGDNMVDKKMGMKPVKNIAKSKKDADAKKETNIVVKGVEELTFTAKTVRGLQKFDATGEKMKKIHESVDKALAKERLKEIIRQELKEIYNKVPTSVILIKDMKEWLKELSWGDMEPEDIDDLSKEDTLKAIDHFYDGGVKARRQVGS